MRGEPNWESSGEKFGGLGRSAAPPPRLRGKGCFRLGEDRSNRGAQMLGKSLTQAQRSHTPVSPTSRASRGESEGEATRIRKALGGL